MIIFSGNDAGPTNDDKHSSSLSKTGTWHGKEVIDSNCSNKISLVTRGLFSGVGVLAIAASHPIIGVGIIALSQPYKAVYHLIRENPLKKTMIEIVGGKEKFNKLPNVKWNRNSKHEINIEPDSITHPVMLGKGGLGELLFVLFKNDQPIEYVKVYCFGEQCEPNCQCFESHQMMIEYKTSMTAEEGYELQEIVKKNQVSELAFSNEG